MWNEELKEELNTIKDAIISGELIDSPGRCSQAGAKLLLIFDEIIRTSEKATLWIPKEYSKDNLCIIACLFKLLEYMPEVNDPFTEESWVRSNSNSTGSIVKIECENKISFYELAYSRCCSIICQLLGDRIAYIQKVLIRNVFGANDVCSLFASDVYIFISRVVHPHNKTALCQIIMNLCKLAPAEAVVKGAALVNRFKHPIVNFTHPDYQYILDLD